MSFRHATTSSSKTQVSTKPRHPNDSPVSLVYRLRKRIERNENGEAREGSHERPQGGGGGVLPSAPAGRIWYYNTGDETMTENEVLEAARTALWDIASLAGETLGRTRSGSLDGWRASGGPRTMRSKQSTRPTRRRLGQTGTRKGRGNQMAKLILAAILMGCGVVQAADCPPYPDDVRDLMLMPQIKERQSILIRDAAFKQEGCKISLVLIVNAAITEEHAKELGDDFVRDDQGVRAARQELRVTIEGRSRTRNLRLPHRSV